MKGMPAAIAREAVVCVGGAILAAWIIGQCPQLKAWIQRQWAPDPR